MYKLLLFLQNAVMHAMAYPKCAAAPHPAQKLSCQLDKALVNVGALLAEQVSGRVCTEIDPRLAGDKGARLERFRQRPVPLLDARFCAWFPMSFNSADLDSAGCRCVAP